MITYVRFFITLVFCAKCIEAALIPRRLRQFSSQKIEIILTTYQLI